MVERLGPRGFSTLLVVAVLVIAGLGFGGWWVFAKRNTPSVHPASTKNKANATTQESDPSKDREYLVIKEWGVRFRLPDELRGDVHYGLGTTTGANNSEIKIVSFEVGKIVSELDDCRLTSTETQG